LFLFYRGCFRFAVLPEAVAEGQEGVTAPHSGSGVTHHLPDAFPEVGPVTVDGAAAAGRLVFTVGAPVKTVAGVPEKVAAGRAEIVSPLVALPAVEANHGLDGAGLLSQVLFHDILSRFVVIRITLKDVCP